MMLIGLEYVQNGNGLIAKGLYFALVHLTTEQITAGKFLSKTLFQPEWN
jgi:hypothetical protein